MLHATQVLNSIKRIRPRDGRAENSRSRFLERCGQADRESDIPEAAEIGFEGYRQTRSDGCEVLAIIKNGQGAPELKPGEEGEVILDHTPFYAESGGQVGDRGWFYSDDHNTVVAEVKGAYYPVQGVRAHQVVVKSPPSAKNAEGGAPFASATKSMRSSTLIFAKPPCGITPPRICFMPDCAKCWASM